MSHELLNILDFRLKYLKMKRFLVLEKQSLTHNSLIPYTKSARIGENTSINSPASKQTAPCNTSDGTK